MKKTFTLSEVLITLVVIGIIAAITVPIIIGSHKKIETSAKLKKFNSTMTNAFQLAAIDNGEGPNSWNWCYNASSCEKYNTNAKNIFNLIFPYLKPYLNISKYIEEDKITNSYSAPKVYLSDGTYFYVGNWIAGGKDTEGKQHSAMVLIYDVNGNKNPNQPGRDQFAFFFYEPFNSEKGYRVEPSIPIVPSDYVKSRSLLKSSCQTQCKKKSTVAGEYCLALIVKDGWDIKNDYPCKL